MMNKSKSIILQRNNEDSTSSKQPPYKALLIDSPEDDSTFNLIEGAEEGGRVKILVKAVALNRRDCYIVEGLYPNIQIGGVLGADAAGVVINSSSGKFQQNERVLINSSIGWKGREACPESILDFGILGMLPLAGTFSKRISIPSEYVYRIPPHLSFTQAAAFPLAGLTAYRAVVSLPRLKDLLAGEGGEEISILIPGIGGGVSSFALLFAKALGCKHIWTTSSSKEKIKYSIEVMGAEGGVLYTNKNYVKELQERMGLFDIIIDGSGGSNLKNWIRLAKPGGHISIYGAVVGSESTINLPYLWFKHLTIHGSCMGSNREFGEMMELVREKGIVPVLDERIFHGLESIPGEAIPYLASGKQFGKVVVNLEESGCSVSPSPSKL